MHAGESALRRREPAPCSGELVLRCGAPKSRGDMAIAGAQDDVRAEGRATGHRHMRKCSPR
jgi:hypothetical protein